MPRSAIALPINGASLIPRVASGRSTSARPGLLQLDLAWRSRISVSIGPACSLSALGARGKAHGLVGSLEQGTRLAHAFGLLALRHGVGDDAGASTNIHGSVLHHGS